MKGLRRLVLISLILVLAIGAMIPAYAEEPVTLTMWTLDFDAFVKPQQDFLDAYMAEHPNVTISLEPVGDLWTKGAAALAADVGPDIMYWMSANMYAYYLGGKMAELPQEYADHMDEYWPISTYWWGDGNGSYYGIPDDYNYEGFTLLTINRTLMEQYGFSVPEEWIQNGEPANYDEVLSFAQSITQKSDDGRILIPGLVGLQDYWNGQKFFSLVWQAGGTVWDDETQKYTFSNDTGRQVLEFMRKTLLEDGIDSFELGKGLDQFVDNGRAFMAIGAPHWAAKIVAAQPDMDFIMLRFPPVLGDTGYFFVNGGWGYSVLNTCENKDVAWDVAAYCARPENAKRIELEGSMMPPAISLQYDPYFTEDPLGSKCYPAAMSILENGRTLPLWTIDLGFVLDTVAAQVEAVYAGEADIDTALATMDELVNTHIDELKDAYEVQ